MWKAFYLWEADSLNSSIKFHGQFYFHTGKNIGIVIISPREAWLYQGQIARYCEVCHGSNNIHPQRSSRMQISPFHVWKKDHESNEVETDPYDTLAPPLTTYPCLDLHVQFSTESNENILCLKQIVMGYEKWVLYNNVEWKRWWSKRNEPPPTTPKAGLHPKKVMLCIWWDWKGVLYYELLLENQTIYSYKLCSQLDQLKAALYESV